MTTFHPTIRQRLGFALGLATWLGLGTISALAAESYTLKPAAREATQVETRVDVQGELKLLVTIGTDDGGKSREKTSRVPVTVQADLRYSERPLLQASSPTLLQHSLRHYATAQAEMKVGRGEILSELGQQRRIIVLHDSTEATNLFSPAGPLEQAELDLLLLPFDSGLLTHLLPSQPVKLQETWKPSDEALARLLRWEVVNTSDVKLTLDRVEKNIAIIAIAGRVAGEVEGVTSDIELTGKLNFDIKQQLCASLAVELKEDRAASPGTPGFETTSRIKVALSPAEIPAELADGVIADLKTQPDDATRLLRLVSANQGFELVHEPGWRSVSDQPQLAVLRLLDGDALVAQCNISRLTPLPAGEQLTLEGFQQDLKRSLAKSFGDFVEASESLSESGLRVLRVVVAANVSDVPIQYVFYHLSDDRQNRASLAFTMDAEMVERFGRADETLVGSFTFTKLPESRTPSTGKPSPQKQAQKPTEATKK
jgi:hypothetical protein